MNNYIYIFQAKMLESSHGWLGPSAASTLTGLSNHFTLLFHFLRFSVQLSNVLYGYSLRKGFCFLKLACVQNPYTLVYSKRRDLFIPFTSHPNQNYSSTRKKILQFFIPLSFSPYFLFCFLSTFIFYLYEFIYNALLCLHLYFISFYSIYVYHIMLCVCALCPLKTSSFLHRKKCNLALHHSRRRAVKIKRTVYTMQR